MGSELFSKEESCEQNRKDWVTLSERTLTLPEFEDAKSTIFKQLACQSSRLFKLTCTVEKAPKSCLDNLSDAFDQCNCFLGQ
jgi:hypothetical protein